MVKVSFGDGDATAKAMLDTESKCSCVSWQSLIFTCCVFKNFPEDIV